MKTNKSYAKRIRVTKTGKILAAKRGGSHYNAKESRVKQLGRKRTMEVTMTNKSKARFLANL